MSSMQIPARNNDSSDSHDTLKYSLLGPSLTKAGQDSVDQQKVLIDAYNIS
jgi:DNA polymerase kappa